MPDPAGTLIVPPFDLLVRNGQVVTTQGVVRVDVGVRGESIAALLDPGEAAEARRVVEARDRVVAPGGIDAHVHFDLELMGKAKHTFESGTIAAAFGGTTTVIDFALDFSGQPGSLVERIKRRRAQAEGKAVIDFAFHCGVNDGSDRTLDDVERLVADGVPSFKLFTVYRDMNLYVNDATLHSVLERLAGCGGMAAVHTENADLVEYYTRRLLAAGKRTPVDYPASRPSVAEAECIRRVIYLAGAAKAPVYIVHIAAREALAAVKTARAAGQPVYGETCPHYMVLTEAMYQRPDGYNYIMSPPLRSAADNMALWEGLAGGWLSTVSSDDNSIDVEDKRAGLESFDRASPGCVDVETRLPIVFSEGVAKERLSIERMVEVTATNPARIFGLYPKKGVIAVGSDADLVLIDPRARLPVSVETLHMQVQYSPYAGWEFAGLPTTTISKGQVIVDGGQFLGRPGAGSFLKRSIAPRVLAQPC
jgi:dihydropyrimidinase